MRHNDGLRCCQADARASVACPGGAAKVQIQGFVVSLTLPQVACRSPCDWGQRTVPNSSTEGYQTRHSRTLLHFPPDKRLCDIAPAITVQLEAVRQRRTSQILTNLSFQHFGFVMSAYEG